MKQNFEQIIKDSVSNHEVPYEAGAWEKFQTNIPASTPFYKSTWFMAAGLLAVVAISVLGYSILNTETKSITNQENSVQNNIAEQSTTTNTTTNELETTTENLTTESTIATKKTESNLPTTKEDKVISENKIAKPVTKETPQTKAPKGDKKPAETTTVLPPVKVKAKPEVVKESEMMSADFFLDKKVCEGNKVYLVADNKKDDYSYVWNVNNDALLKGSRAEFTPNKTGANTVILSIRDKAGKVVATKSSTISVIELPEVSLSIKNDEFAVKNDFRFETSLNTNNSVKWDLGDGTTSNNAQLNHTYKQGGNINVTCTVTNEDGCTTTEKKKMNVKGLYNIRTDYGFSPNGDNVNDNFLPVELTTLDVKFSMNIYSRNGQLIYTTNSVEQPWNGTMQNGSKCPFGSYVWVVTLTNEYGNQEVYKGTVTNVTN